MTAGQTAPRTVTGGLRAKAWWKIRLNKPFTLLEMLDSLADGTERAAKSNLGRYIRALARAGILGVDEKRQPGAALTSNGHIRYRLVRDLGREAPVYRKSVEEIYDPNSGGIIKLESEAKDAK